jgi:hypothetical protein
MPSGAGSSIEGQTTAPADELDLEWTTDPFTGMRMPAFLLPGGGSG